MIKKEMYSCNVLSGSGHLLSLVEQREQQKIS